MNQQWISTILVCYNFIDSSDIFTKGKTLPFFEDYVVSKYNLMGIISAFVSIVLGACHGNIIQMSLNVKVNNWLTELRSILVPYGFSQCWIQLFYDSVKGLLP